jgi:hypothetical protein
MSAAENGQMTEDEGRTNYDPYYFSAIILPTSKEARKISSLRVGNRAGASRGNVMLWRRQ